MNLGEGWLGGIRMVDVIGNVTNFSMYGFILIYFKRVASFFGVLSLCHHLNYIVLKMADHLAETLTDYGARRRLFTVKNWSRFIDMAYTMIMELQIIQFEAHAGIYIYSGSNQ